MLDVLAFCHCDNVPEVNKLRGKCSSWFLFQMFQAVAGWSICGGHEMRQILLVEGGQGGKSLHSWWQPGSKESWGQDLLLTVIPLISSLLQGPNSCHHHLPVMPLVPSHQWIHSLRKGEWFHVTLQGPTSQHMNFWEIFEIYNIAHRLLK